MINSLGHVVMFEIPAAPQGFPIAWEGHYYGRDGENIGPLNLVDIEKIRNQTTRLDWSAQIIPNASIADLDENAIQTARAYYKTKFPNLAPDVDIWDTLTFLNKAKVTTKRMFKKQKERYFPLPEYKLKSSTVSVTIHGQILSQEYAKYLANHKDLSLNQVIILDKAQKNKALTETEEHFLNQIGFSLKNSKLTQLQVSNQESKYAKQILRFCEQARSRNEILRHLGLSNQLANYNRHLEPILLKNWIERTKVNSKDRNQKYILTEAGRNQLEL